MLAKFEKRSFENGCDFWIKKYSNLANLPHWHFESELVVCICGSVTVNLSGNVFELNKGQCCYIPSEKIHSLISSTDTSLFVVQLDRLGYINTKRYYTRNNIFNDDFNIINSLNLMYTEIKNKAPFFRERINALMSLIIIDIFRSQHAEYVTPDEDSRTLESYKLLLEKIDNNFDEISFEDAAKYMNMSEGYFSRYFKKKSGVTFSQYLNTVKISKAIDIIGSEPGIMTADLMKKCGFNTLRNFNRVFKEITGYSPKALPNDYSLMIRSLATDKSHLFDPTLTSSVEIP